MTLMTILVRDISTGWRKRIIPLSETETEIAKVVTETELIPLHKPRPRLDRYRGVLITEAENNRDCD
jgi:hypothetical protein